MKRARIVERGSLTDVVSGVELVNGAGHRRGASDYPPRWSRVSRWVRGRAGWRCELCGVKNGPAPNVLTVHHLDGNKWNLLPWNLVALCQRMPLQGPMDGRLLPIRSLRHLHLLATGTRESLQCVGTRKKAYAIRLGRLRRSKQMLQILWTNLRCVL